MCASSSRVSSRPANQQQVALQVARSGETAIAQQYEMWLMPVAEFLKLQELRPHQRLRAEGKLVRWNAAMKGVFFLSHQWTSFTRPDHSTEQLRTVQRILTRMLQGDLPETAPNWIERARFASKVKVTSRDWRELAPHACVWMDFISVRARHCSPASFLFFLFAHVGSCFTCVRVFCAGPSSRNLH